MKKYVERKRETGVGPGKLLQPEPEPATKPAWIKIYSLYPKPPNPEKALPNSTQKRHYLTRPLKRVG